MTVCLVAFPGFLFISSVSGMVNVMSVVVPVSACVLILGSLEAIIKLSLLSEIHIKKCEITVSVCIMESINTRASEMRGIYSSAAEVTGIFGV
jgi:hypothetical protein